MKAIKVFAVVIAIVFCIGSLNACSVQTQDPYSRTVKITTPLSQPTYGCADTAPFDDSDTHIFKNSFIFKGKIDMISEAGISWNSISTEKEVFTINQWISICNVSIENILNGSAPDNKETIKVVFYQSTRNLDSYEFRLLKGYEYYFITYEMTKSVANPSDHIRISEFGDASGGTFFDLFPVNDGVVSYNGWKFTGSTPVSDALGRTTGTIDEKSFLEQFTAKIQAALSKLNAATNTPNSTSNPN